MEVENKVQYVVHTCHGWNLSELIAAHGVACRDCFDARYLDDAAHAFTVRHVASLREKGLIVDLYPPRLLASPLPAGEVTLRELISAIDDDPPW